MKKLTYYTEESKRSRPESENWREPHFRDSLYYSYRDTVYDRQSYPSRLHYHEYYELVAVLEGDIQYSYGDSVAQPTCGNLVIIPPGTLHTSSIHAEKTRYRRHVFYFYPNAFDKLGGALLGFLSQYPKGRCVSLTDAAEEREFLSLLGRLRDTMAKEDDPLERILGTSLVLQIFYLLNRAPLGEANAERALPKNARLLRQYLDEHYAEITSVEEVAAHFFYSREYVCRLFRKQFHTTVSEYLRRRRIIAARERIAKGEPLIDVCYGVGFGNLSTFIRSFEQITGMTPSQYRKMIRE